MGRVGCGVIVGGVLDDAFEAAFAGDDFAVDGERVDEVFAGGRDAALDGAGVDGDGRGGLGDVEDWADCSGGGCGCEGEPAGGGGAGVGGEAAPLEGAVGPVGHGPGLEWEGGAIGGLEGVGLSFFDYAFGPGNSPADGRGGGRRGLVEPVDGDRLGLGWSGLRGGGDAHEAAGQERQRTPKSRGETIRHSFLICFVMSRRL